MPASETAWQDTMKVLDARKRQADAQAQTQKQMATAAKAQKAETEKEGKIAISGNPSALRSTFDWLETKLSGGPASTEPAVPLAPQGPMSTPDGPVDPAMPSSMWPSESMMHHLQALSGPEVLPPPPQSTAGAGDIRMGESYLPPMAQKAQAALESVKPVLTDEQFREAGTPGYKDDPLWKRILVGSLLGAAGQPMGYTNYKQGRYDRAFKAFQDPSIQDQAVALKKADVYNTLSDSAVVPIMWNGQKIGEVPLKNTSYTMPAIIERLTAADPDALVDASAVFGGLYDSVLGKGAKIHPALLKNSSYLQGLNSALETGEKLPTSIEGYIVKRLVDSQKPGAEPLDEEELLGLIKVDLMSQGKVSPQEQADIDVKAESKLAYIREAAKAKYRDDQKSFDLTDKAIEAANMFKDDATGRLVPGWHAFLEENGIEPGTSWTNLKNNHLLLEEFLIEQAEGQEEYADSISNIRKSGKPAGRFFGGKYYRGADGQAKMRDDIYKAYKEGKFGKGVEGEDRLSRILASRKIAEPITISEFKESNPTLTTEEVEQALTKDGWYITDKYSKANRLRPTRPEPPPPAPYGIPK